MTTVGTPRRAVWGCLLLALCPGCWGSGSAPKTIKVLGRVTYKGESVTAGTIVLQPVKPAEGYPRRPATGTLRGDGSYELSTFESGDGVVPGEYGVAILSFLSGPDPENPHVSMVWNVPKKYASHITSGQTASIPPNAGATVELNFDLEE